MKILLISPLPPPAGGIATWTKQYIDYMNDKNISIEVANISVTGKRVLNYTKKNIFTEIFRSIKIITNIFYKILIKKYDLVHINTSCSRSGILRDKIIVDLLHFFKENVILQCHCNVDNACKADRTKKVLKKIIKKTSKCLVLNKISFDYIKENYGVDSVIVPNFISDEYMLAVNEKKQINLNIKTALFVGHILASKGCDVIIESAPRFPEIQFRLVGHISQQFRDMDLPNNVVLLGEKSQSEVHEEYKNADFLLFPTHTEGFPLTIIEAMSYGLPIVTTKVGAIPDILESQGAIYTEVGSKESLIKSVEEIKDYDVRLKLSSFNQKKVETYFINNVLEELIDNVYEVRKA